MVFMTFATWLCSSSLGGIMSFLHWYWIWSYDLLWWIEYGVSNVPLLGFGLKKPWIYSLYLWNLCLCYENKPEPSTWKRRGRWPSYLNHFNSQPTSGKSPGLWMRPSRPANCKLTTDMWVNQVTSTKLGTSSIVELAHSLRRNKN